MRIGIDARLINETGVGRYIRNLIREIAIIDANNQYVVFLRKNIFDEFILPGPNWQKRLVDVPWHSISEQLILPFIFSREKLDLLHVPYFNAPIFYPGKYVMTIHDLTILKTNTGKASTLPFILYKVRRLGYQFVLRIGANRATQIITVSKTVKKDIVDELRINSEKIKVTYEGIDRVFLEKSKKVKRLIDKPYFLYVGNVYPHKNVEILVSAMLGLKKKHPKVQLVFVGKRDFFYNRLQENPVTQQLTDNIIFAGEVSDVELKNYYHYALALLFPSKMEGFGLPGLEALASKCLVIAAKTHVFTEILDKHALFVDPDNLTDWINVLDKIASNPDEYKLSLDVDKWLSNFSWIKLAQDTLKIYENSIGI